jgi:RHS repeat-associated protein
MTRRDGMSVLVSLLLGWLLLVSPVLQAATETITWIHTDHLGSPVMGRNASGQTVWQQDYGPWGERVAVAGSPGVPEGVGYTGHYEDRPMGLVYAGARWYDPQVGRFLSPDAVRFDVGGVSHFNRYVYANNNPYLYVDPNGEAAHIAIGAVIGGIFGGASYALSTDNFSLSEMIGNVATGAVVGGATAAVPGAIAAGALNFGGRAANVSASLGSAAAAGAMGDVANQIMSGDGVNAGNALIAGGSNVLGMVGGRAAEPFARPLATTRIAAREGLPVQSLSGRTFYIGERAASSHTHAGIQQGIQEAIGGAFSSVVSDKTR